MSIAEFALRHGWAGSALSHEARVLSRLLGIDSQSPESLTVGAAQRAAQEQLDAVSASASVQDWDGEGAAPVDP